jgi:ABC-type Na+ transport system ATPase subunit NatA
MMVSNPNGSTLSSREDPLVNSLLSIDCAGTRRTDLFPTDLAARSPGSLALVGQWRALFQVLTGEIVVGKHAICVRGEDARAQVIAGQLGVLPSRFEWPHGHNVEAFLELSAGLLGMSPGDASREAERVLVTLALLAVRRQQLAKLSPLQLRQVALAHALLGSPKCLAIEEALLGLTTQDSLIFLETLAIARQGRALIVNVPHATPGSVERLLIDGCEEVLVHEHGAITYQGSPTQLQGQRGLFQLTIQGMGAADGGRAVCDALQQRGVVVRSCSMLPPSDRDQAAGPRARLVVALEPEAPTLALFAAAKSCDSTLLDLHPLSNVE